MKLCTVGKRIVLRGKQHLRILKTTFIIPVKVLALGFSTEYQLNFVSYLTVFKGGLLQVKLVSFSVLFSSKGIP